MCFPAPLIQTVCKCFCHRQIGLADKRDSISFFRQQFCRRRTDTAGSTGHNCQTTVLQRTHANCARMTCA